MIIAVAGKAGSGKDTVGNIIQYLTSNYYITGKTFQEFNEINTRRNDYPLYLNWQVKKFAGKLKQIVSTLTGISVEDLEKQEIKDRTLGKVWTKYILTYTDKYQRNVPYVETFLTEQACLDYLDEQNCVYYSNIEEKQYTVRQLLQEIGTEAMRNEIHPDIWVNALFNEYIPKETGRKGSLFYPHWIITDLRFPNELQAVKDREGITIRVNRKIKKTSNEWQKLYPDIVVLDPDGWNRDKRFDFEWNKELITLEEYKLRVMRSTCKFKVNFKDYFKEKYHTSETALDNAKFDYEIDNTGTIGELIEKVKQILIKEKIL